MKNQETRLFVAADDGVRLCAHCIGDGPAVLLLHGFLSNATVNWFTSGVADALARAGRRVIAPDFRAHGASAAPPTPAFYPKDILARDIERMIAALNLEDFALVGYSLGARIAARLMARGAKPRRLVLAGMGDTGLTHIGARQAHFEDAILHGPLSRNPKAGAFIQEFMRANGVAPGPALHVLQSQSDTPAAVLAAIACPTLILCGARDEDNGSSERLAAMIPNAHLARPPGDHLSAVGAPGFREALLAFLQADLT